MKLNPWLAGIISIGAVTLVSLAALFGLASSNAPHTDPEGIAYLIFFVGAAVPGLVASLFVADKVIAETTDFGKLRSIFFGVASGILGLCGIYLLALFALTRELVPVITLAIPAGLSIFCTLLFSALRRPRSTPVAGLIC